MKNPWEEITLSDYESHMSRESVGQLRALRDIMKRQLEAYPAESVMVLGAAGGNGFEYAGRFKKVYAVDVNREYLKICAERYPFAEPVPADLSDGTAVLPRAGLVIADLLVEYIGCERFAGILGQTGAEHVCCVIQLDEGKEFVSNSPCAEAFRPLEAIHRAVSEEELTAAMEGAGYAAVFRNKTLLPNGKFFLELDFARQG